MTLLDIFKFIKRIQDGVGCGCRVSLDIFNGSTILIIRFYFPDNYVYQRAFDATELKYIVDADLFVSRLIFVVQRAYKLATVGEE